MNCYICGGTYRETTDSLEIKDDYVGSIYIEGVPYFICDNCGKILYTKQMSQAVEKARDKRIEELLGNLPLGAFVSASETASLLKISRQALNKNRRISNGFIYYTKIGSHTVFLRQSILRFMETGDGRFSLSRELMRLPKYIPTANVTVFTASHFFNTLMSSPLLQSFKVYESSKEKNYAKG